MDLERLIAAEEQNEARLAAARAEAAALVAAAKGEAAARETAHREAVARALSEVDRELAEERQRQESVIGAEARAARARYDGVSDAAIAALVPALVGRLVAREVR